MRLFMTLKPSSQHLLFFHVFTIAFVATLAYSNTFSGSFHLDDYPYIAENPIIREMNFFSEPSLAKGYQTPVFGYHTLNMRYVGLFSFALNYRFHGLDVAGYHLLNLIIHIINCLLVYQFVIECFATPVLISSSLQNRGRLIALFTSLIFCAHPIQTQAVTYITQRFTSLATLFFLLSLLTYIKSRMSNRPFARYGFYAVSVISAVLAMKTKEIAFTLPFVIILFDILFLSGSLKERIRYLAMPAATSLIIPFSLISLATSDSLLSSILQATRAETSISRWDYLFTQFRVTITYLRLLIMPMNQNIDYDYPIFTSLCEPNVYLSLLVLLIFFGFAVYLVLRTLHTSASLQILRLPALGIFWFFITLSVESTFIPTLDVIFEHRLYLPSVGFILMAVTCLFIVAEKYRSRIPVLGKIIIVLLGAVVILLLGATFSRNAVWADESSLWTDVVTKSPRSPRAHLNLGSEYNRKGSLDEAIAQYQAALDLKPDYAEAHNGLGLVYMYRGLLSEAAAQYEAALRIKPRYAAAHYNYGLLYINRGEKYYDKAREELEEALRINPSYDRAMSYLRYIDRVKHSSPTRQ